MKKTFAILLSFVVIQSTVFYCFGQAEWRISSGFNDVNDFVVFDTTGVNQATVFVALDTIPLDVTLALSHYRNGKIRYLSNGISVFNSGFVLPGPILNPCTLTTNYANTGLPIQKAQLFINSPSDTNYVYLFHYSANILNPLATDTLYYSLIDNRLNNGKGGYISENNILYNDTLECGGIVATRHANGRDWWVIVKELSKNNYIRYLLTSNGIIGPYSQSIGPFTNAFVTTSACFSPDGGKYVVWGETFEAFLFNFDRCTGLLSNPIVLDYPDSSVYSIGGSFSPNCQYLYLNTQYHIYQFDCLASNIQNSKIDVAVVDTFSCYLNVLTGLFSASSLAPDNRIYIATWHGCPYLQVINFPDLPGLACGVTQHSIALNGLNSYSVPNQVNYKLGPVIGSVCDSLTGFDEDGGENNFTISPNPVRDILYYNNLPKDVKKIFVYDIQGKLLRQFEFSTQDQVSKQMDVSNLNSGVYFVKVISKNGSIVRKFIIK